MADDDWITTHEAAQLSRYHPEHLRRLLNQGQLEGRKFGIVWQISRQSLLDYLSRAQESRDGRRGPKPSR